MSKYIYFEFDPPLYLGDEITVKIGNKIETLMFQGSTDGINWHPQVKPEKRVIRWLVVLCGLCGLAGFIIGWLVFGS